MDPVTLGILGAIVVGFVLLLVVAFVVRAWIRTVKLVLKLAFYALIAFVAALLVAGGAAWVLYGDQIRAALAG